MLRRLLLAARRKRLVKQPKQTLHKQRQNAKRGLSRKRLRPTLRSRSAVLVRLTERQKPTARRRRQDGSRAPSHKRQKPILRRLLLSRRRELPHKQQKQIPQQRPPSARRRRSANR